MNTSHVFVDLDSVLDTRLGVLLAEGKIDNPYEYLTSFEYYTRGDNALAGMSVEEFEELFKNRDKSALVNSVATLMCLQLSRFIAERVFVDVEAPATPERVKLTVNVYPYVLTEEEMRLIESALIAHTGELVEVECVNMLPSFLTPMYLKNRYDLVVMYDYASWLESQQDNFEKVQIPEIDLLIPALAFRTITAEDAEYIQSEGISPFDALELMHSGLIGLTACDVKYWCAVPIDASILAKATQPPQTA